MRLSKYEPTKSDRGITPIISVILLIVVAITLGAIVAAYSIGLTDLLTEPPQAGITLDQQYNEAEDTYDITVVVSSMPNAEKITVQGPITSHELDETGEHVTLTNLERGELLVVTASKGSETVVIREYRVG